MGIVYEKLDDRTQRLDIFSGNRVFEDGWCLWSVAVGVAVGVDALI